MIFWSGRSLKAVQTALEKQKLAAQADELFEIFSQLLVGCFPDHYVLVKDRQGGFNQQKLQHALFVEIFDGETTTVNAATKKKSSRLSRRSSREVRKHSCLQGGRFAVIKIGLADRIELELQGWHAISPKGAFRPKSQDNSTLLAVFDHPTIIKDSKKRTWKAIQYQDAQQKIGDVEILSLERATLFACQANRPRRESVMDCIKEVFIRLDENLYRGAQLETASTTSVLDRILGLSSPPHSTPGCGLQDWKTGAFPKRLARWSSESQPRRVNRLANGLLQQFLSDRTVRETFARIRSPVEIATDYFHLFECYLQLAVASRKTRSKKTPSQVAWFSSLEDLLSQAIPNLTRGRIHGDLHGQNIQVGLFQDTAHFPVVFDYEFAGPEKLIAWDLIKLEYEIKNPVIPEVFGNLSQENFFKQVFELEASAWEMLSQPESKSATLTESTEPWHRLRDVIVGLRRHAATILGNNPRRDDWQEEYRFLSMLYAVTSVDYGYTEQQRLATWVSGAVAAHNTDWNRLLLLWDFQRWENISSPQDPSLGAPHPTFLVNWRAPHKRAQQWIQSVAMQGNKTPEAWTMADTLLKRLTEIFPTAAAPWEDRLLLLLEMKKKTEFQRVIANAEEHITPTEEFWCRLGRVVKDDGFDALQESDYQAAIKHFLASVEFYSKAYDLHQRGYPQINLAAVHLYLAAAYRSQGNSTKSIEHLAKSQNLGGDALKHLLAESDADADPFWECATQAEALFLSGRYSEADQCYERLRQQYPSRKRDLDSATRQSDRNQFARSILDGHGK
jgi:hypothetical protein